MSSIPDPRSKQLIEQLESGQDALISSALQQIREHGTFHIIPALIKLMLSTRDSMVESECAALLCDLTDPRGPEMVSNAIAQNRRHPKLASLVATCWMGRQDYAPHLALFVNLAIEEDYLTTLEAFSVIEENIAKLDTAKRMEYAALIEGRISKANPEKQKLLQELISVIKPIQGPFFIDREELS